MYEYILNFAHSSVSPQIYTQPSVKKEQNRKHQRAEVINNIPVNNIQIKYFDNEETRTRKLCEFAQSSQSAFVNFLLLNVTGCFHADVFLPGDDPCSEILKED
jgi:hypothetical protein